MKRLLIYLSIITLAAWLNFGVLITQTSPKDPSGNPHLWIILGFFALGFIGLAGTITIALSLYKVSRPHHKLPPLIVKDSLAHAAIIASWVTGLLVLQFFQVATWINIALWTVITLTIEWLLHEWHKKSAQTARKIAPHHV